uniref:WAP domain-containing protein n=1 Tax=Cairina moschata TaxID=8855 RepID=A0A8C3D3Z0_CAIMO
MGHRGVMLLLFLVLPSGDPPGLQPPHLVGTAWSCPRIRITCAIPNPPNKCDSSWQCPRHQKCCQGACGRRCLSRPPGIPTSHGTVLSEPPAVAVALGREVATAFRAGGGSGALSQPLSLSLPFRSVRARGELLSWELLKGTCRPPREGYRALPFPCHRCHPAGQEEMEKAARGGCLRVPQSGFFLLWGAAG